MLTYHLSVPAYRQVESVLPFQHFFAICGREDGLERVWLATKDNSSDWRAFARSPQGHTTGEPEPHSF